MELYLLRRWFTDKSTIGELFINDNILRECFTLEPTTRVGKDPRGIVAIPDGRFEVTLYQSSHFKMIVPILNNIPGHKIVEIHPGDFPTDTHDCVLVGSERGEDRVFSSRSAFYALFPKIDQALNTEQVFLNVKMGATA
jgi:hypothetical protein